MRQSHRFKFNARNEEAVISVCHVLLLTLHLLEASPELELTGYPEISLVYIFTPCMSDALHTHLLPIQHCPSSLFAPP